MLPTVLCIATSHGQVERMVERLTSERIGELFVMFNHAEGAPLRPIKGLAQLDNGTPDVDAAKGALTGGLIGGLSSAAGLVVLGAWPMLFVTAPLTAAAGAAVGAVAGAAAQTENTSTDAPPVTDIRTPRDFGIPEAHLLAYQNRLDSGDYLVAVRTENESELARAQAVFEAMEGEDINLFRLTRKLT